MYSHEAAVRGAITLKNTKIIQIMKYDQKYDLKKGKEHSIESRRCWRWRGRDHYSDQYLSQKFPCHTCTKLGH